MSESFPNDNQLTEYDERKMVTSTMQIQQKANEPRND